MSLWYACIAYNLKTTTMETKKKFAIAALMVVLVSSQVQGAICEAIASGNWSDPAIWSCGSEPGCGDIVIIPEFITVDLDVQVDLDETTIPACSTATFIQIYGTLFFVPGQKMYLACGSVVEVMLGGNMIAGGGGSSNLLYICQEEQWRSSDGDVSGYAQFGEPIPLSSEFVDFNAKVNSGSLDFDWTMESETDIDHFTIEYSTDGKKWIVLLDIQSVGDHDKRFVYDDIQVEKTIHSPLVYFKLSQNDINGKKLELSIKSVQIESGALSVSPNPINSEERLFITLFSSEPSVSEVNFYNSVGQFVKSETVNIEEGINRFGIGIEDLSKGIYLVKVPGQISEQTVRIIVN